MSTTAIAINATLKKSSGEKSSTDAMIALIAGFLKDHDAELVEPSVSPTTSFPPA